MDYTIRGPLSDSECAEFVETLRTALSWEWDTRFKTALAQISMAQKDGISGTLEKFLGRAWNSDTIETAPERVQCLIDRLGGIMAGQLLYASVLAGDEILFCAWWPWGNGQTVSLRFGTDREGASLIDTMVPRGAK